MLQGNIKLKTSIVPLPVRAHRFSSFLNFIFKKKAKPLNDTDVTHSSASKKVEMMHPGMVWFLTVIIVL